MYAVSKQRRQDAERDEAEIDHAIVDAQRQGDRRLFVDLGRLAHFFDVVDQAWHRAFADDAAQARQQAVERTQPLRRRAAAAGEPVDALADQLIDAEQRDDVLDAGDGDLI